MNYIRKIGIIFTAVLFMLTVGMVSDASAQTSKETVQNTSDRPVVIVRNYYWRDPFSWGFYDNPHYYDPYLRERRERYYDREELRGNRRELSEHREEYRRDGVITAEEREELNDDIRDVREARAEIREYRHYYDDYGYYGRNY